MGKKKYIFLLLLLLMPLVVTTGISTWIIIKEDNITDPVYNYQDVLDHYIEYDAVDVYNGKIQIPTIEADIAEDVYVYYREYSQIDDNSNYKLVDGSEGPKDVGSYQFKVVADGLELEDVKTINYKIDPNMSFTRHQHVVCVCSVHVCRRWKGAYQQKKCALLKLLLLLLNHFSHV